MWAFSLASSASRAASHFSFDATSAGSCLPSFGSFQLRPPILPKLSAQAGVTAVAAVPSSASSARPSDIATQVKIGVSRSVYSLDSVLAQLHHEVEEVGRLVGLERDHELLVVEPERVGRVDRDCGISCGRP